MARKPPSAADAALITAADARGKAPTAAQLERWRAVGLLPRNEQHGAGRGRGSVSVVPPEAVELVLWLGAHARPGRPLSDLALEGFGAGLPIPEATVRAAWIATVTDCELEGPPETQADTDRSDWIADVAQDFTANYAGKGVLLPRRIRTIDARIAAAGISFATPEMAAFDRGTYSTEPYTSRDFLTTAVLGLLGGTSELTESELAGVVRALVPAGAAVAVASMLEYPDDAPRLADINDGNGLSLLPVGDIRADIDRILSEASLAQLLAAWKAVDGMRQWAVALCDAVDAELDSLTASRPLPEYPGLQQWFFGATFGLNRLLLRQALREPKPSTRARAGTAVTLLYIATGLSRLRVMVPDSQFELLPVLMPPFLHHLAELVATDPPASLRPPALP